MAVAARTRRVAPAFAVERFAKNLPSARTLRAGPSGARLSGGAQPRTPLPVGRRSRVHPARPPSRSVTEQAPPYRAAALAGTAVFFLYVLTLAPTTAWWDASEYIATAHTLGIPHPPGNPLFVVLGRAWSLLLSPLGLPVAVRINLFSAATSAGSAAFLFLVAHRVASAFVPERWMALAGASASALLSGTVFTVWSQSNVNEKVYTLSVLIGAAVSWLALVVVRSPRAAGKPALRAHRALPDGARLDQPPHVGAACACVRRVHACRWAGVPHPSCILGARGPVGAARPLVQLLSACALGAGPGDQRRRADVYRVC